MTQRPDLWPGVNTYPLPLPQEGVCDAWQGHVSRLQWWILTKNRRCGHMSRKSSAMAGMSSATALRNLQQAQAGMKKARQALRQLRGEPAVGDFTGSVLKIGWESLKKAHTLMAEIPLDAANDDVLTRQLSVQRYSTALLVRLRRVVRNEPGAIDFDGDDLDDDGDEDL